MNSKYIVIPVIAFALNPYTILIIYKFILRILNKTKYPLQKVWVHLFFLMNESIKSLYSLFIELFAKPIINISENRPIKKTSPLFKPISEYESKNSLLIISIVIFYYTLI